MAGGAFAKDEQVLEVLDLVDNEGLSFAQAADVLSRRRGEPITRAQVAGVVTRVRRAEAALGWDDEAISPENRDGGMPRGWWRRMVKG